MPALQAASTEVEKAGQSGLKLPDVGNLFNSLSFQLPSPGTLKIGNKRLVVITGASSGLGKEVNRRDLETLPSPQLLTHWHDPPASTGHPQSC
eukprot:scaffold1220_cov259-Pinguiococcus_pyrenoidosus.AAC.112